MTDETQGATLPVPKTPVERAMFDLVHLGQVAGAGCNQAAGVAMAALMMPAAVPLLPDALTKSVAAIDAYRAAIQTFVDAVKEAGPAND